MLTFQGDFDSGGEQYLFDPATDGGSRVTVASLSFTQAAGGLNVQVPPDANTAPPGHYLLSIGARSPSRRPCACRAGCGGRSTSATSDGIVDVKRRLRTAPTLRKRPAAA